MGAGSHACRAALRACLHGARSSVSNVHARSHPYTRSSPPMVTHAQAAANATKVRHVPTVLARCHSPPPPLCARTCTPAATLAHCAYVRVATTPLFARTHDTHPQLCTHTRPPPRTRTRADTTAHTRTHCAHVRVALSRTTLIPSSPCACTYTHVHAAIHPPFMCCASVCATTHPPIDHATRAPSSLWALFAAPPFVRVSSHLTLPAHHPNADGELQIFINQASTSQGGGALLLLLLLGVAR
jgi:hypothetical protein